MTQNYDEVENFFKYWEKDSWKHYIETNILILYNISSMIIDYSDFLQSTFNGKNIEEIEEIDKVKFLGGVDPKESALYKPNSLAKFYFIHFGISLSDLRSYFTQESMNEHVIDLKIALTDSKFFKFVKEINLLLETILKHQPFIDNISKPKLPIEGNKLESDVIQSLINDFYVELEKFSLSHNYATFFISSLNHVSFRFIKTAYPQIIELFDYITDLLGLKELNWQENPMKPDTNIGKEYTIFSYPEFDIKTNGFSLGGKIKELQNYIWRNEQTLEDSHVFLFKEPLKSKNEYINKVQPKLRLISDLKEKLPTISDYTNVTVYFKGLVACFNNWDFQNSKLNLLEILDQLFQLSFIGLFHIDVLVNNQIRFNRAN